MYTLTFDEEAIDFLSKLPLEIKKRIYNKITSTKEIPHHYFEKLEGRSEYKLRVGDYRVIADIDDNSKKIHVLVVGHRRNIYKNM